MTRTLQPGVAPIKAEYIISAEPKEFVDDDAAEGATGTHERGGDGDGDERPSKRAKMNRQDRKKNRGANKGRRFTKSTDGGGVQLCFKVANGGACDRGDSCKFSHDIPAYLASKDPDILFPFPDALTAEPPFVRPRERNPNALYESVDASTVCSGFLATGECKQGWKCRFLGAHVRTGEDGTLELVKFETPGEKDKDADEECNFVGFQVLKALHGRKYPLPLATAYLKSLEEKDKADAAAARAAKAAASDAAAVQQDAEATTVDPPAVPEAAAAVKEEDTTMADVDAQKDTPDVPMRPQEKRRLNWTGKTYLAPLTTVGNLPFRRLCVSLGADITCGEMGLATSFLQGSREEWSLVRRHPSERTFGVQLCGNKPTSLVTAAEAIARECGPNIDFVDVNCGCPIDLVFQTGAGSALLDAPSKLSKIVVGMSKVLGEIPVTIKLRTGVKDGKNTAHKLMPRLPREFGVGAVTIHGRTRQQRYTKLADWDYIKQCVETLRQATDDENLPTIPIFGGGDCFSYESYKTSMEQSGVDGIMIGRGALIKPWLFTEIKEQRSWDISSRERLELIRQYCEFGLNHFGSDTTGVNSTRRFLCEALSFQYRYIPVGLLERLPAQLNERPPAYRGRDELETMLASGNVKTWVEISEMFLGKAPEEWVFTPKHKSNAYGSEEGQG
ncbi:zinc finger dihydrouridine synthase [Exidia glandulosa HHB12029]|uniref:tRNA-dihydrouridine(47) synthase [NAD(P)(+)] n=1 Tax=Exidia glandulosa HHB12029 TaxID=1314781 RepID=A0A165B2F9_EXIGL|nr:zinc finger dihydrouridine synthase [Exidia glandulosa HHB12029]